IDQHHRGVARGLPRCGQQAPRGRDQRGGGRVRRATGRGRAFVTTYRIAAIPGDGVGPEVVAAGRAVLDAAGEAFGFDVAWSDIAAGGNAIDAYGVAIRPEDVTRAGQGDA